VSLAAVTGIDFYGAKLTDVARLPSRAWLIFGMQHTDAELLHVAIKVRNFNH
jgi:hypothetical protein